MRGESLDTADLHEAFIAPLADFVTDVSEYAVKPMDIDLVGHPGIRLYIYNLVSAKHTTRKNEYKAVLRVFGQKVGSYGHFDTDTERLVVLAGYSEAVDVFVLWDAALHPRFKNGGNIQVRADKVHEARDVGSSEQTRRLAGGVIERVLLCRGDRLAAALNLRAEIAGRLLPFPAA